MTTNTKRCRICRAEFTPTTGGQRYCSPKCSKKARQVCQKKYHKKYHLRQKLAKQQEQETVMCFGQMVFEPINVPGNHGDNRPPDPYWGF